MEKLITEIFRSRRKEGAYVYMKKGTPIDSLPSALREQLGGLESAMVLVITEDKKLARAEAKSVMQAIADQGFYLQMPPVDDELDYKIQIPNDKLSL